MALTDLVAFTTVAAVEAVAGDGVYADSLIEQKILAVSARIEREAGRSFRLTQVTTSAPESVQGNGLNLLPVNRYPITAVERVREDGVTITDYERDTKRDNQGLIYRTQGWSVSAPSFGDVTNDPDTNRRAYNYDVAYTGGYVLPNDSTGTRNFPYDLEEVCIQEVLQILQSPSFALKSERTPGGYSYDRAEVAPGGWLPNSLDVIWSYRRSYL